MEIGKSHPIGEMGQETVGSLSLPRPQAYAWGGFIFPVSLLLGWFIATHFQQPYFGLGHQDGVLAPLVYISVFPVVIRWLLNFSPRYQLQIPPINFPHPVENEAFEIWSAETAKERAWRFFAFIAVLILLVISFPTQGIFWENEVFVLGVGLTLHYAITFFKQIRRPILIVDSKQITIIGQTVLWKEIGDVQVRHLRKSSGEMEAVRLKLTWRGGGRIGDVSIPENRLDAIEEERLLQFISRALGQNRKLSERRASELPSSDSTEDSQEDDVLMAFLTSRYSEARSTQFIEVPLFVVAACLTRLIGQLLVPRGLWPGSEFFSDLATGLIVILLLRAVHQIKFSRNERILEIERGRSDGAPPIPISSPEFWSGSGIAEDKHRRPLALTLRFLMGFTLLMFGLFGEPRDLQIVFAAGFLIWGFETYLTFRPRSQSLMEIGPESLRVNGQFLDWQEIESVRVKHVYDLNGEFEAVKLIFCQKGGQKIAQVSLPKDRCPVSAENALLRFITGVLGGTVKTVASARQV